MRPARRTAHASVAPKKSLGQNFLRNPYYLRRIADAAHIKEGGRVLEIGPGEGALTEELLAQGAVLAAVEKDRRLIPVLRERFAEAIAAGRAAFIEADALRLDPAALGFHSGDYAVVGNIPYYITGALVRKFLGGEPRPHTLVFLMQKEVAERIAKEKKESILSLSVKAYGTPRYGGSVPRGAFHPAPGVDSAILAVEDISRAKFKDEAMEERFFELVRAGFSSKRKLLRRNLEPVLGEKASAALEKAGIGLQARAEDVPLEKWLTLSALR